MAGKGKDGEKPILILKKKGGHGDHGHHGVRIQNVLVARGSVVGQ